MTTTRTRFLAFLLVLASIVSGCARRSEQQSRAPITRLNGLTIRFLDVGQGDAALIQWEDKAALIDGGPPEDSSRLLRHLRRLKVRKLDWVFASHPHADHIGGLVDVVREIPVTHFVDSGFNSRSPLQAALLTAIRDRKVDFRLAHEDQTLDLGDGVALYFFTPPDPLLEGTDSDANNNSIVARLMYGKVRVLLTGDLESIGRKVIYSHTPANFEGPKALRADVLKCAHHGSRNGTDAEWLDFVRPRYAVISCAAGNRYGHPHAQTLKALRTAGVQLHRTDLEGEVTMTTDGTSITMRGARSPARSVWSPGRRNQRSANHERSPH